MSYNEVLNFAVRPHSVTPLTPIQTPPPPLSPFSKLEQNSQPGQGSGSSAWLEKQSDGKDGPTGWFCHIALSTRFHI